MMWLVLSGCNHWLDQDFEKGLSDKGAQMPSPRRQGWRTKPPGNLKRAEQLCCDSDSDSRRCLQFHSAPIFRIRILLCVKMYNANSEWRKSVSAKEQWQCAVPGKVTGLPLHRQWVTDCNVWYIGYWLNGL